MRERDRKRRDPEDGNPNDQLAPVTVTERTAEDGADRNREEKEKEVKLRALHGEMEFVDEVEGVVVR